MNRPVENPVPDVVLEMWRRFGAGDLREAHRLTGRSRRTYACIGHRGDSLIVRLSDSESSRTSLEAAVSARCARAGIPVPTVIHTGIEETSEGTAAVTVQEKLPGVMLGTYVADHTVAEAHRALAQAGEALCLIHGVQAEGFGPLDSLSLPALQGTEHCLGDWFVDELEPKIDVARSVAPDEMLLLDRSFTLLSRHRPVFDTSSPGLLHGDFSPTNILVDDSGCVTGIVDWEAVKSGPPEIDIGWWDCFFNTSRAPASALIEGYERHARFHPERFAALRHLTVIRIMLSHFAWTLSVSDTSGIRMAVDRLRLELDGADAWSIA